MLKTKGQKAKKDDEGNAADEEGNETFFYFFQFLRVPVQQHSR